MVKIQGRTRWDSNLRVEVCPIPLSLPYPLRHRLQHRALPSQSVICLAASPRRKLRCVKNDVLASAAGKDGPKSSVDDRNAFSQSV
ncbi:hypothetical protein E2C01_015464 [Portunus trituberculatus]|uniref:Uncharacterized protein n=1 Tax=Portunus trituberculatus TaxID=210409 RepID=A0A5B7DMZ9_PORTR|nr:hypothetical protein [Portunus trituberculatus]